MDMSSPKNRATRMMESTSEIPLITAGREGMRRREKKCKEGYRGNKESEKVKKNTA